MILLTARNLARQFDADPVFSGVTFDVRPGEKIGLVGPNGAGKSTLMRILAGLDHADVGDVELHPQTQLAMVEQQTEFPEDRTLIEEARAGLAHLYELQHEAVSVAEQLAHEAEPVAHQRLQRRYDAVQHELQRLKAYNIDHRVDEILLGLGFTPDQYDRRVTTLSGGQQNRLLLARMLLSAPNLMLLDEPTNHLDIATTEWLENYLASSDVAMIVVSHDRYFLDKVVGRILELHKHRVDDYPGNFTQYWKQRGERAVVQLRTYEKQQEELADLKDFIVRNRYGQKHAQAADREKKLARLQQELVTKPDAFATPTMGFAKPTRSADCLVEAVDLSKGYGGPPLFEHVTLRIERGQRLGIFGPNGTGKSTLLKALVGELPPDAGVVRLGAGVSLGYFDQQLASVAPDVNLIEAVRPPRRPDLTPAQLRDVLARFGLRGEIVFQNVGSCSGGEKSKVALARLALLECNLLVLDEPTNHLDLWSCAALEQTLRDYEGTVVFVSHDRYFLDRTATHVLAFEPDRVRYLEGNYTTYLDTLRRRAEEAAAERSAVEEKKAERQNAHKAPKRKRKYTFRKVEDLEADIAKQEQAIEELQAQLLKPETLRDGRLTKQIYADLAFEKTELARLYEHWEEACELN